MYLFSRENTNRFRFSFKNHHNVPHDNCKVTLINRFGSGRHEVLYIQSTEGSKSTNSLDGTKNNTTYEMKQQPKVVMLYGTKEALGLERLGAEGKTIQEYYKFFIDIKHRKSEKG